jgi:uncharacterized membrane protein YfcA
VSPLEIIELLAIGLCAGVLGGILGIGGSVVMIPAMAVVLGPNQHLYQAAAMIVNVFVAVPATVSHLRAQAVRWDVGGRMLPFGVLFIVVGVVLSDAMDGRVLQRVFGVFLIYVIVTNLLKLRPSAREPRLEAQRTGWPSSGGVGALMGLVAGLLGVGGGIVTVPLLQRICNLPLRQCIATSSAVMCLTALIGAARKNAVLDTHPNLQSAEGAMLHLSDSLVLAACLAPTAIVGGLVGAALTHRLPLRWIRVAFILLMGWASVSMLRG